MCALFSFCQDMAAVDAALQRHSMDRLSIDHGALKRYSVSVL